MLARLAEVWHYRQFLWFLSIRTVTDMFKDLKLGYFWLFARPLIPVIMGAVIFGGLLQAPSDDLPYFLFFLTGTAIWRFFFRAFMYTTRGLEMNRGIVKQVYVPRLLLPISALSLACAEFLIFLVILALAIAYYAIGQGTFYVEIGPGLVLAALLPVLTAVFAVGLGLFTSVWMTRARDVRYGVRYGLRVWALATPIIYPLSRVPEQYQKLFWLNPMTAIVEHFKWGLLGVGRFDAGLLLTGTSIILLVTFAGLWYFGRFEATSVDNL